MAAVMSIVVPFAGRPDVSSPTPPDLPTTTFAMPIATTTENFHFLRIKPLSKKTTNGAASTALVISTAMRHNLREIQAEFGTRADGKIDALRIRNNVVLHGPGTAAQVAKLARDLINDAGVKVRKNATVGIEIVVSLPAGTFIDCNAYFTQAMHWTQAYFNVPLLSAVIHNDEANPHVHIVLLPLRNGRLVASELLGDRAATKAMHKQFHEQIGSRFGLHAPQRPKRHPTAVRKSAIEAAYAILEANSGLNPEILRTLLAPHLNDPAPLLSSLGIGMPDEKVRGSFVATMTKPCKSRLPVVNESK